MTQNQQILKMLKRGPITQLIALEKAGCMRLSERIRELKSAGHNITSERKRLKSGKYVAEYRLT